MLITAYGKLGDFNSAEKVLSLMNKNGYPPNVVSQTALMEAYGRGGRYNNAEAIFRRMQRSGPEPSAVTYQIILKTFVEVNIHFCSMHFNFVLQTTAEFEAFTFQFFICMIDTPVGEQV